MFITTKSTLDDLLNHFQIDAETRNEAYRLYAMGMEQSLENLISKQAGLPPVHAV